MADEDAQSENAIADAWAKAVVVADEFQEAWDRVSAVCAATSDDLRDAFARFAETWGEEQPNA